MGEIDVPGVALLDSRHWGLLLYRPRNETIIGQLDHQPPALDQTQSVFTTLEINVQANPLGLFAGAVVGTLLGSLFVATVRLQSKAEKEAQLTWTRLAAFTGNELGRASFLFVKATVAAGIVILVLQSASGVNLLDWADWSVGQRLLRWLVMGLVGERVASAVYDWIGKSG